MGLVRGGDRMRVTAVTASVLLALCLGRALAGDETPGPPALSGREKAPSAPAAAVLTGRVERGGAGVAARVRAWVLPSLPARALARAQVTAEATQRLSSWGGGERADPSWWLSPEAAAKATRVLANGDPGEIEGRSGEDGAFRLEAPTGAADWLVLASAADGFEAFSATHSSTDGTRPPIALRMPAAGLAVEGRLVRHDGAAFRGAVAPVPDPLWFAVEDAIPPRRTDEAGRFRFERVPEGGYRLRCTGEDGTVSWSPRAFVPLAAPWSFVVDEPTRLVRGRVRTPTGAAIAEASLRSSSRSDARVVLASARSDGEGAFAIRLPLRPSSLLAEAEGSPPRVVEVAADAASVEVVLTPFVALRGRVVDAATGAGVAGVPVRVVPVEPGDDDSPFSTTSGDDGTFEVGSPPSGSVHLLAFGAGFMSADLEDLVYGGFDPLVVDVAAAASEPVTLRVVPAARLEGRVVDRDGAAVEGARVSLEQADPMQAMCGVGYCRNPIFPFLPDPDPVVTGADGAFVVPTLRPALLYHASVAAPGFSRLSRDVVLEEGGPSRIVFTVDPLPTTGPPRPVVARVVSSEGQRPLPGVEVTLSTYVDAPRSAVTGEDGIARFEAVPAVDASLEAERAGRIRARASVPFPAERPGAEVSVTLTLEPALTLGGRVLSPSGEPVPDATVSAGRDDRPEDASSVRTSADGRFLLGDVPPGTVSVHAWAVFRGTRMRRTQDAQGGERDVQVRLVEDTAPERPLLESGGKVRFRVTDVEGRPVARGRFALRNDGNHGFEYVQGFSGGALEISPADKGLWSVLAFAGEPEGDGPLLGPVETPRFRITSFPKDLVIRMPPGRVLSGRVVASDGTTAVAGVALLAYDPATPTGSRRPPNARGRARSGTDGAFRIEGLGAGPTVLSLEVPPSFVAPAPREVVPTEGEIVRLEAAVRPWITVLDVEGRPVEGALVAVGADGTKPQAWDWNRTLPRTGPTGRVRLGGLDPGRTYALVVALPTGGYSRRELARSGWRPADTTVRASPPATVSGRIHDPDGAPIEGAWIAVDPTGSSPRPEWKGQANAAADGTFTTAEVPPGPGVLRFGIGAAGPTGALPVTAPATDVDLVLDPGPSWVITLVPPVRTPGSIHVWWTPWREDSAPPADRVSIRTMPWTPVLRFRGLVPDHRYALYVHDESDGVVGWVPDLPGEGGSRRVELVPAGKISGRVRFVDPSDEEDGAFVVVEGRGFHQADFSEKGAFTVGGLPPGRFTVRASSQRIFMDESSPKPEATETVATGDTVELVVPARPR